jgi:DNA-binding transcriptional LysR family regulator
MNQARKPVDIRHLRYFVAVAETLNFGAAARELHISQPPLSKRIAEFEKAIGVRLFERSTRSVRLTGAGTKLLPQAKQAVIAFDSAMDAAGALRTDASRRIHIGFPPDTSREVLLSTIDELHRKGLEVEVTEATTGEQVALLARGELDVAVLRHPFDLHGLQCSTPMRQTLGVVVHVTHPLARKRKVRLEELQGFALVIFPRSVAPGLYDEMLSVCHAHGYAPQRVVHGMRMTAGMLVAESAVAFATREGVHGLFGNFRDLKWKPIEGEPLHWWTSAVTRRDNRSSGSGAAMQAIPRLLQKHDSWIEGARPAARKGGSPR